MHPLPPVVRPATFFIVTYVLSWLVWIPLVLSHFGVGPFRIPDGTSNAVGLLGVLMPATVALVLTGKTGGSKAVGNLLRPLKTWRVGWRWWGAAVLVQPALLVAAALIYNWLWGEDPITIEPWVSTGAFLVNVVFLLIATLGEEIGWRGLALPGLEQRRSALSASIILGLLWAAWHVPFWLLQDTFEQYGVGYLLLSGLFVMSGTIYITWFYNHGRFSLLLPVVFHVSYNVVNVAVFPVTPTVGAFAVLTVFNCILAVLLARRLEPRQRAATARAG